MPNTTKAKLELLRALVACVSFLLRKDGTARAALLDAKVDRAFEEYLRVSHKG